MNKIMIAAIALSMLAVGSADAAKRKHARMHGVASGRAAVAMPAMPSARTPGPPWAGPGECYTDEGYGRYTPCGVGRGGE